MSCVLRAWGKRFDVQRFVEKTNLKDFTFYLKGKPRFPKSKPKGPRNSHSGFKLVTSEAPFDGLDIQIKDTLKYLRKHKSEIKKLAKFPGVEKTVIDFGIDKRDVLAQFDYFPPDLLLVAGQIGIGLELSQYESGLKANKRKQDIFRLKKQFQGLR